MNSGNVNSLLTMLVGCLCLIIGSVAGYQLKPNPVIEDGVYVNGRRLSIDEWLKSNGVKVPPDGKRKPGGDLPSGAMPPAAWLVIDQDPLNLNSPHMVNAIARVDTGGKCCCDPCTCSSCACHLTKAITATATQAIEQRGGNKSPEILGIDKLVDLLAKFHDSLFGTANKPGLRDDIANGIKDAYSTVRTGVIVAGGVIFGLLGWMALSLQRIADAQARTVMRPG